jgi:hypothetical protein
MNDLAEMREVEDLHGAHQLYEQVLAGRRRVLGDDHPRHTGLDVSPRPGPSRA